MDYNLASRQELGIITIRFAQTRDGYHASRHTVYICRIVTVTPATGQCLRNRVAACATHARRPTGYCVDRPTEQPKLLRRVRAYCQGRFVV